MQSIKPSDWKFIDRYLALLPRDKVTENEIKNRGTDPAKTFAALLAHAQKMTERGVREYDMKFRDEVKKITGVDPYDDDGIADLEWSGCTCGRECEEPCACGGKCGCAKCKESLIDRMTLTP